VVKELLGRTERGHVVTGGAKQPSQGFAYGLLMCLENTPEPVNRVLDQRPVPSLGIKKERHQFNARDKSRISPPGSELPANDERALDGGDPIGSVINGYPV
jgi:hypothetical protein